MKTLNEVNALMTELIVQAIEGQELSKELEGKVTGVILEAYQMGFEDGFKDYDSLPF